MCIKTLKHKRVYVFLIFFFLIVGCEDSGKIGGVVVQSVKDLTPSQRKKQDDIIERLKTLKIGMTREEVEKIMRKPERVRFYDSDGKKKEKWYYKSSISASAGSSCTFDVKTGKVIRVQAGESYYLKKS